MSEKTQKLYKLIEDKFAGVPKEKTCDLSAFELNSESQGGNDQVDDIQWDFEKKLHKTEERIYKYKNCIEFVFNADRTHVWQYIMKYLEKPKDGGSLFLLSLQKDFNDEIIKHITQGSFVMSFYVPQTQGINMFMINRAFVLTDKDTCRTITKKNPTSQEVVEPVQCEKTSEEVIDRLLAVLQYKDTQELRNAIQKKINQVNERQILDVTDIDTLDRSAGENRLLEKIVNDFRKNCEQYNEKIFKDKKSIVFSFYNEKTSQHVDIIKFREEVNTETYSEETIEGSLCTYMGGSINKDSILFNIHGEPGDEYNYLYAILEDKILTYEQDNHGTGCRICGISGEELDMLLRTVQ